MTELLAIVSAAAGAIAAGWLVYRWQRAERTAEIRGIQILDLKDIVSTHEAKRVEAERAAEIEQSARRALHQEYYDLARTIIAAGVGGQLGKRAELIVAEFAVDGIRRHSGAEPLGDGVLAPEFDDDADPT